MPVHTRSTDSSMDDNLIQTMNRAEERLDGLVDRLQDSKKRSEERHKAMSNRIAELTELVPASKIPEANSIAEPPLIVDQNHRPKLANKDNDSRTQFPDQSQDRLAIIFKKVDNQLSELIQLVKAGRFPVHNTVVELPEKEQEFGLADVHARPKSIDKEQASRSHLLNQETEFKIPENKTIGEDQVLAEGDSRPKSAEKEEDSRVLRPEQETEAGHHNFLQPPQQHIQYDNNPQSYYRPPWSNERQDDDGFSMALANRETFLSKIKSPILDGSDDYTWVYLVGSFTDHGNYCNVEKFEWVSLSLSEKVLRCLGWEISRAPFTEWQEFTPKCLFRFGQGRDEEDHMIISAHSIHGNSWAVIVKMFMGRNDNAIKNHRNSTLRRKYADLLKNDQWTPNSIITTYIKNKSVDEASTPSAIQKLPQGEISSPPKPSQLSDVIMEDAANAPQEQAPQSESKFLLNSYLSRHVVRVGAFSVYNPTRQRKGYRAYNIVPCEGPLIQVAKSDSFAGKYMQSLYNEPHIPSECGHGCSNHSAETKFSRKSTILGPEFVDYEEPCAVINQELISIDTNLNNIAWIQSGTSGVHVGLNMTKSISSMDVSEQLIDVLHEKLEVAYAKHDSTSNKSEELKQIFNTLLEKMEGVLELESGINFEYLSLHVKLMVSQLFQKYFVTEGEADLIPDKLEAKENELMKTQESLLHQTTDICGFRGSFTQAEESLVAIRSELQERKAYAISNTQACGQACSKRGVVDMPWTTYVKQRKAYMRQWKRTQTLNENNNDADKEENKVTVDR